MDLSRASESKVRACFLWPKGDVPRPGWLPEDLDRAFRVYESLELDRPRCPMHRRPA